MGGREKSCRWIVRERKGREGGKYGRKREEL